MIDSSRIVVPGDTLQLSKNDKNDTVSKFGPGLHLLGSHVESTASPILANSIGPVTISQYAGVYRSDSAASDVSYVVPAFSSQYDCAVGDKVVGVIVNRVGDFYRVAIRSREPAYLGMFSFQGATKKNRPDANIGDVVYARIAEVSPIGCGQQAVLSCVSPDSDRAEGMGVLRPRDYQSKAKGIGGGLVVSIPPLLVRRLLHLENSTISVIGKRIPFEAAFGVNGLVWVNSRSVRETIVVANVIAGAARINPFNESEWQKQLTNLIDGALNTTFGAN